MITPTFFVNRFNIADLDIYGPDDEGCFALSQSSMGIRTNVMLSTDDIKRMHTWMGEQLLKLKDGPNAR